MKITHTLTLDQYKALDAHERFQYLRERHAEIGVEALPTNKREFMQEESFLPPTL